MEEIIKLIAYGAVGLSTASITVYMHYWYSKTTTMQDLIKEKQESMQDIIDKYKLR